MKIGDPVATPRGPGVVHGFGAVGGIVTVRHQRGNCYLYNLSDVTPMGTPQVDAVVGEQCVAILERLRDALGVASIGEVEAAVMGMLNIIRSGPVIP